MKNLALAIAALAAISMFVWVSQRELRPASHAAAPHLRPVEAPSNAAAPIELEPPAKEALEEAARDEPTPEIAPEIARDVEVRTQARASVHAAPPTFRLRGRVLDASTEEPIANWSIVFVLADARRHAFTRDDGTFGWFSRTRMPERIEARDASGWIAHSVTPAEARGESEIVLHVQPPRIAGSISGWLQRESGPWTQETLPAPDTVQVELVSLADPSWQSRAALEAAPGADGAFELAFAFPEVPEGDYQLSLSSLGSRRWHPASLRVTPPCSGLTFLRYDLDRSLPLTFRVFDAKTDAPIEAFQARHLQMQRSDDTGIFLHTGPLDLQAFPIDTRFEWSLWADGYAPAFGDESSFRERDGTRIAEVYLSPGWATRFLVLARDPVGRPASGAEIVLDGAVRGRTGGDGTCVVRAGERPQRVEVRLAGWRATQDPLQPFQGRLPEQRGQVTVVMLERAH